MSQPNREEKMNKKLYAGDGWEVRLQTDSAKISGRLLYSEKFGVQYKEVFSGTKQECIRAAKERTCDGRHSLAGFDEGCPHA